MGIPIEDTEARVTVKKKQKPEKSRAVIVTLRQSDPTGYAIAFCCYWIQSGHVHGQARSRNVSLEG